MPKILVADDSIAVRKVAERLLTEAGLGVTLAANGEEALALLAKEVPDLIVSDVIMPDKSGYEVCAFVRGQAALAKTPVLLISGIVNDEVTKQAESCHADGVLKKPFQGTSLKDRVLDLLGKKQQAAPAKPAPQAGASTTPAPSIAMSAEPDPSSPALEKLKQVEAELEKERRQRAELTQRLSQLEGQAGRVKDLEVQAARVKDLEVQASRIKGRKRTGQRHSTAERAGNALEERARTGGTIQEARCRLAKPGGSRAGARGRAAERTGTDGAADTAHERTAEIREQGTGA